MTSHPWLIANKTGLKLTTFKQLYDLTGKQLRITATCVTCGSLRWFDKDLTPDMPIATAVRASSTFPVMFQPVEWDGHLYVDGGLLHLLPHTAFNMYKGSTVALRIRPDTPDEKNMTAENIRTIIDYGLVLMDTTMFGKHSVNSLYSRWRDDKTIDIIQADTNMVSPEEIELSHESRVLLIKEGYESTKRHLRKCEHIPKLRENEDEKLPEWLLEMLREVEEEKKDKAKESSCSDGVMNGDETDIDQGGSCVDHYVWVRNRAKAYKKGLAKVWGQINELHEGVNECLRRERSLPDGDETLCSVGVLSGRQERHEEGGSLALHHFLLMCHFLLESCFGTCVLVVVLLLHLTTLRAVCCAKRPVAPPTPNDDNRNVCGQSDQSQRQSQSQARSRSKSPKKSPKKSPNSPRKRGKVRRRKGS